MDFINEFGEETKFDENGDPVAMYDLINWQLSDSGEIQYVTVGRFDETKSAKLEIDGKNIIWNGYHRQVSLCVFKNLLIHIMLKSERFILCMQNFTLKKYHILHFYFWDINDLYYFSCPALCSAGPCICL